MSVAPIAATSLPWLLLELSEETSQEPQRRERNPQQGNRNAFALGWLPLPKASTDAERGCRCFDGCYCGSVMVVASIVANVFALMPCVPLMVAVALVGCLNSQRERNRNEGIGTPLPFFCWGEFKLILCYLIIICQNICI